VSQVKNYYKDVAEDTAFTPQSVFFDAPVVEPDSRIYGKPWDNPKTLIGRWECSVDLAENLLDIDIEDRAALYSRLGDEKLIQFFEESESIQNTQRGSLYVAALSFTGGLAAAGYGLVSAFNSVSLTMGGVSALAVGIGVVKSYLNCKKRNDLVERVNNEIKAQDIRLPQKPVLGYHRREPDLSL
jgi:hypothetical protein